MRESILTIPINEVFEPKEGCPFCRMRDTIEDRCVEYIMGAAMMEPDVRIKSNELGFCKTHYEKMLLQKNRLSLGLILSTHLEEIKKEAFEKKALIGAEKKKKYRLSQFDETCFVCDRIEWGLQRLFVTFYEMYSKSDEFRQLFNEQEYICLHHYKLLAEQSEGKIPKKMLPIFEKEAKDLVTKYLDTLINDVTHFTKMYDYRNTGSNADWGNSKDSIERAIKFLTSR